MPDGVAEVSRSLFGQTCSVAIAVAASPERVWSLLTDTAGMPAWCSTVTRVEGRVAKGEKLAITVPASSRTFRPKVVALEPRRRMVWADGQAPMLSGVRTFRVEAGTSGTTFTMEETIRGLMLPLIARSLPDLGPVFERYAADLKAAAEAEAR